MFITKQRALDYVELEWGMYVERFNRLPEGEQSKRIKKTGFESLRDLLAHILAWWEEGLSIMLALAEQRPFERKKYDFDVFNAAAVARYTALEETEFMAHFEKTLQKMAADLKSMDEALFQNRRIQAWLRAVITRHAREHILILSPFLVIDMLENDWATYIEDFHRLDTDKQRQFLSQQGFENFHDLLAHVIGWWEEGARIVMGMLDSPAFTWQDHETDSFNAELVQKYSSWSDEDLQKHFESVRLAMIDLVSRLPEDAFINKDIEDWLVADVVEHYEEHPIPA